MFQGQAMIFSRGQRRPSSPDALKIILDNMPFGVAMFDGKRNLVVCNEQYAKVYGLPPKLTQPGTTQRDILQHRISGGVYAGTDATQYMRDRIAIATEGKSKQSILQLSTGRILSVRHCPLPDGGWVSTHEDITEHAALQNEQRRRAAVDRKST